MHHLAYPPKEAESLYLTQLKAQFKHVFNDPSVLPTLRGLFYHRIPIEPHARLVNIWPYRYPLKQRDVIETLIQEMLDRG